MSWRPLGKTGPGLAGGAGLPAQPHYVCPADAATVLESFSFRMSPVQVQARLGEKVKLHCEVLQSSMTSSCSWLYQKPGDASRPIFLMYLSSTRSKPAEGLDTSYISGTKAEGANFHLTLHRFHEEDQGYYFCSFMSNSVMYFSNLVPVFLPGPGARSVAPLGVGFGAQSESIFHTLRAS